MPDSKHPNQRKYDYRLSMAETSGQLVKLSCRLCKITHHYRSGELTRAVWRRHRRTYRAAVPRKGCGNKDYLEANFILPYGPNIPKIRVRELVEVNGPPAKLAGGTLRKGR